ncbi:MAG TPA: hypothetical protein VH593_03075, partial [Ktedonobacteraceae bacterium]
MQIPAHPNKFARRLSSVFLVSRGLALLIVLFLSALVVIPLVVLLSVALKTPVDLLNNPMGWPARFVWSNFVDAWKNAALGQAFFNSVLITGVSVLGLIICGSLAAYPLARFAGPWFQRTYVY